MNLSRELSVRRSIWSAMSCLMIAVAMAAPVNAQTKSGQISLKLSNTPLTTALSLLTQQTGAQMVVSDGPSLESRKVTVNLSDRNVDEALSAILTASNVPWYRGEDGTYFINSTAPVAPIPADLPEPARIIVTEKIELRNQSPSMIMRALGMDSRWSLEGSYDRMPGITWSTAPSGLSLSAGGTMSGAGDSRRVRVNGRDWEVWGGNAYPLSATDTSSIPSIDEAGQDVIEQDMAGQVGFPRTTTTTRRGGTTNQGPVTNQATTTSTSGQQGGGLVPDEIEYIYPFQEDNSLLVKGPPDQIDIVKKLVELLDIAVKQVSIKAEFITVSDGDSQALGLNWAMSTLNSSIASDIGGTGEGPTITIGVAQGNLDATLTALRQRSRARTLLAPLISTLNNVPATIYTAESYPVFQPSIVQGGTSGGGNIVTYTPSYITATTGLDVLPRINRDGSVTVQIQPQVTQFTRNVTGPNNITLPVTVQQTLRTVRRVKSGESIVLGGLANKTLSKTTRGIPFLEDLPFVGRFFRSNDDRVTDSQLLIFLTPTIVEETGGAQLSPG
jgi:general secretion pathway protein D